MPNESMQACIDDCQSCHSICLATIQHCLQMGGKHAAADHLRLMMDCAEICQTSANFMLRGSNLHAETCRACAEVCDRCAEDCARVSDGQDQMMQRCVDACRRCSKSCHQMAGAAV